MSVQALRNWEVEGKIMPSHRTPGGQRMSDLAELLGVNDLTYPTIAYARVSSSDQKKDYRASSMLSLKHFAIRIFLLISFSSSVRVFSSVGWQAEHHKRLLRVVA